ncbi:hypothetical protein BY996DRAFT_6650861 [Phakopsora pachyrhizi]|nr:hypothetical protein BY996DRAFT_6650861 [Phakopsora pachyrhizi]
MGMFSSSSSSLSIRVITLLGVIILTSSVLSQFGNIFEVSQQIVILLLLLLLLLFF